MSESIDIQKNVNISGLFTMLEGWNESISVSDMDEWRWLESCD